ncbi:uncharacterized protein TEOVI_000158100 [Trypanosoma equiperdum]|uniref:Uncharacterized protein n=2 Tax=Trypanozoon TaxID=39700 RepID=Q385Y0_TRYB2|nr:hypothetical protein, conserved [Trypanosoma brucei brucei TREU927]EAN79401.1 hypothetical protein, conserved [Trypanosoma brucei brucei TREU927]SCU70012.1 hypothetical protein, conserved [Trypanosoma equiperdum]
MNVPVKLSGRCYWGKPSGFAGSLVYMPLTGSEDSTNHCGTPLTFLGNSYYERRFGRKLPASCVASLPPLYPGDVVVKSTSATPASFRSRRLVDVTGIQTSFFDASERNRSAHRRVDDVIQSMHLYDGHEVPELHRGSAAVGKVMVFCAYPTGTTARSPLTPSSLVILENAAASLLNRRSSLYHSDSDGVQLVRVIAESCRAAAAQGLYLRPVVHDGCVLAVRLHR